MPIPTWARNGQYGLAHSNSRWAPPGLAIWVCLTYLPYPFISVTDYPSKSSNKLAMMVSEALFD